MKERNLMASEMFKSEVALFDRESALIALGVKQWSVFFDDEFWYLSYPWRDEEEQPIPPTRSVA